MTGPLVNESAALVDAVQGYEQRLSGTIAGTAAPDAAEREIASRNARALEIIDGSGRPRERLVAQKKNAHAVELGQTAISQTRYARGRSPVHPPGPGGRCRGPRRRGRIREIQAAQIALDTRLLRLVGTTEARIVCRHRRESRRSAQGAPGETLAILQDMKRLQRDGARLRDTSFAYDGLVRADGCARRNSRSKEASRDRATLGTAQGPPRRAGHARRGGPSASGLDRRHRPVPGAGRAARPTAREPRGPCRGARGEPCRRSGEGCRRRRRRTGRRPGARSQRRRAPHGGVSGRGRHPRLTRCSPESRRSRASSSAGGRRTA